MDTLNLESTRKGEKMLKALKTLLTIILMSGMAIFFYGCENDSGLEDAAEDAGQSMEEAAEETGEAAEDAVD